MKRVLATMRDRVKFMRGGLCLQKHQTSKDRKQVNENLKSDTLGSSKFNPAIKMSLTARDVKGVEICRAGTLKKISLNNKNGNVISLAKRWDKIDYDSIDDMTVDT